jgi:DNA-binding GntR family transcriptional regulator
LTKPPYLDLEGRVSAHIRMVEMNDGILPIGRAARSLPEQVAEHLLEAIVAGRIPAGTHLKELALAREHAVSRATIREALIALEKSHFVERIPRFGVRVTELGAEDVFELFEVRGSLLGLAAGRCAKAAKPAFLSALRRLVTQMHALAVPDVEPHRFGELSVRAQHLVLAESVNPYCIQIYQQLAGLSTWRLVRNRALSHVQLERRIESARDWAAVVDAIARGDSASAETAARSLLSNSAHGVRAELALRAKADTVPDLGAPGTDTAKRAP